MNIAVITPGFAADDQDLGIPCLAALVTCLASHHRVTVLTLEYPQRDQEYRMGDVPVLPVGPARFVTTLHRTLKHLRRLDANGPVDVIHAFFAGRSGAIAAIAARRLNRPLVITVMGGELVRDDALEYGGARSPMSRLYTRHALSSADAIVSLSPSAATLVPSRFRAKQRTIPLGVDPATFYPGERSDSAERPFRLLSIGSLTRVKGHRFLLAAIAQLRAMHNIELNIIGTGPLQHQLITLVAELGITDVVQFHGELPHASLPPIYRTSDALVVASLYETQSMVAVEAAMCGCLVVGTSVGILPEILPAHLVAVPGDVDSLVAALEVAISIHRTEGGKRLRTVALEHFNISTQAAALERCYETLIDAAE